MPPTLHQALSSLDSPKTLPHALPACHLADARSLESIGAQGQLTPWFCKVFEEELVYVFYGGLFYRRSAMPTADAAYLPIGLVFQPLVLNLVDRYYPFDTGAAHFKKYGEEWHAKLHPFKDTFRIPGEKSYRTAARMVHHLFGTNQAYLTKPPRSHSSVDPEPLPTLLTFLSDEESLAAMGVDQRYRRFEGHITSSVPLDDKLIWVGYPEEFALEFARLCEGLQPVIPKSYAYPGHPARRPSEMAAILQDRAHQDVIERYVSGPPEKL